MRKLILLATFLFGWANAMACSCFGPDTFCGVLNPPYANPEWWIPDAVVMAVPLQQEYYGIDVVIVHVYSGTMNNDTVRVWGDNGALCRQYTGWSEGDTLILGLHQTDLAGNTIINSQYPPNLERSEDYMISGCGVYLLDYANGAVHGPVTAPEQQHFPIAQFLELITGCALQNGVAEQAFTDALVISYASGIPTVCCQGVSGMLDLAVLDMRGEAVLRKRWDGLPVSFPDVAAGAYLVQIMQGDQRSVRRMVKF